MVPEVLAGVHVGDVHLDEPGTVGDLRQGIPQRDRGVGEPAGVDDHGLAGVSGLVDAVDQLALVVGLQEVDTDTEPGGVLGQTSLDVGQGGGAVDLGLALSEAVEIRTVEDQDAGHWCASGVCGVWVAM